MLKKHLLTIFITLASISGIAQDNNTVVLTPAGIDPIVYNVEDKPSKEIYEGIKKYITLNYNNPDEVLKGDIPNEYVSISGFVDNAWSYTTLGVKSTYGMFYRMNIDIKENRYRVTFLVNDFTNPQTPVYYTYTAMFRKDGTVRKVYSQGVKELENTVNTILLDLYANVNGTNTKNDDW